MPNMKIARVNAPIKFWGKTDWDNWWKHVTPQLDYDDIRCDTEEVKCDTYRLRCDDEGEE